MTPEQEKELYRSRWLSCVTPEEAQRLREAAALGEHECAPPTPKPANDIHLTQEQIDDSCIAVDDEDYDPGEECGRWENGWLSRYCSRAGTEFCDWDCPYSR